MAASSRKLVLTCGSVIKGCVKSALFSNSVRGFHLAASTSRLPSNCVLRPGSNAIHRLNPVILSRGIHVSRATSAMTKGDEELVKFLKEEISAEKKTQKAASLPTSVGSFKVSTDGASVKLTKDFQGETIRIDCNVNHSVNAAIPEDVNPPPEKEEEGEMQSKPNFDVEITKGNLTLGFSCAYVSDDLPGDNPEQEEFSDKFTIDEVYSFEGEFKDETYAVSGDILDGYLYDLLMNLLEERGISNEFVDQLQEYCTLYEQSLYIKMLEQVQKFLAK